MKGFFLSFAIAISVVPSFFALIAGIGIINRIRTRSIIRTITGYLSVTFWMNIMLVNNLSNDSSINTLMRTSQGAAILMGILILAGILVTYTTIIHNEKHQTIGKMVELAGWSFIVF